MKMKIKALGLLTCMFMLLGCEVAFGAARYYTVRLVTGTPASCSGVYNDAGLRVVHRCGGEDCYREVVSESGLGVDAVRDLYDHAIIDTPVTSAEVKCGVCDK